MAVVAEYQTLALTESADRFWAKVDRSGGPDACWPWLGARSNGGHGMFRLDGKTVPAHRVAVMLDGREIPPGHVPDHLCRQRHCNNPRHLEVVSHRENTLRGAGPTAQHAAKDRCLRGHEFTEANTIRRSKGRECRACREERERRRPHRNRAAYFSSWRARTLGRTA